jgi:hypothetical protein
MKNCNPLIDAKHTQFRHPLYGNFLPKDDMAPVSGWFWMIQIARCMPSDGMATLISERYREEIGGPILPLAFPVTGAIAPNAMLLECRCGTKLSLEAGGSVDLLLLVEQRCSIPAESRRLGTEHGSKVSTSKRRQKFDHHGRWPEAGAGNRRTQSDFAGTRVGSIFSRPAFLLQSADK